MRVTLCVDALQPQLTGIGRYTWELCNGLCRHEEISTLKFYRDGSLIKDPARLLRDQPRSRRFRRLMRRMRREPTHRALRNNLVHGPNYFLPLQAHTGVITVHDLSVLRFPETHPAERVAAFERLFASSLSRAAYIITDTEMVRHELIDSHSLSPERVCVVPLGVDSRFRPMTSAESEPILRQWNLIPGNYGLSVAAFEPRKKLTELIAAWRRLPARIRGGIPLVLAGGSGWRNDELHGQIQDGVAEGWLKYLGYIEEAALPALYSGARLFVYPSIYEGFGLPPLEAMASGTPVLVSGGSCSSEVCGNAAGFIDPDDSDDFTRVIEQGLTSQDWRTQLSELGFKRARGFGWDKCVTGTVAVYRKAFPTLSQP